MLNKNSMVAGVLAASIFPAMAWFVFGYLLKGSLLIMGKPGIPYLVAIALNLILIKIFFKKGADQTGTGAILSTFVYMALIFLLKMGPLR